jgi:glycosyltransferase involved in cell wall biosynthesis
MKPRVILATTVFDDVRTGPGLYAQYLWDAFRDDPDFEFHVVAPRFRQEHPRFHAFESSREGSTLYHGLGRAARELTEGRERQTLVHGNTAHAMFDFVGYPGPWIVQVNDYEVATLWRHACGTLRRNGFRKIAGLAWRRKQEKLVLPTCTRVVCNSDATRRSVLKAYRTDAANVVTIHKAADVAAFQRPESLPPDPAGDRPAGARLAFVGTNWAVKGLDVLLRAMKEIPEATLVVAGRDPARYGRKIEALCERLGLSDRVFFLGPVDHAALGGLLWHSDVFVLPSRMEAFGVAVLEALAAGVPVVATEVGGIPEIVRDGVDGLLVPSDRPAALAAAIGKIVSDESLKRRLAEAGPPRAEAFRIDRMIASLRQLYVELLAN